MEKQTISGLLSGPDFNRFWIKVDGRVAHVEALQCLDEDVGDKEVPIPLAIRRNHIPGSVVSAGF